MPWVTDLSIKYSITDNKESLYAAADRRSAAAAVRTIDNGKDKTGNKSKYGR